MKRRDFLKNSLKLGVASTASGLLVPNLAFGQDVGRKPFVINIYTRSWCGFSSGLFQPIEADRWQKGAFVPGQQTDAHNPLLNVHTQDGNFVWHTYSRILSEISDQMTTAIVNARQLNHGGGMFRQTVGQEGNASFLVGAAQGFANRSGNVGTISANRDWAIGNPATSSVVASSLRSLTQIQNLFRDGISIVKGDTYRHIWEGYVDGLAKNAGTAGSFTSGQKTSLATFEKNLYFGAPPEVNASSPLNQQIDAALSRANVDAMIDKYIPEEQDGAAVKALYPTFSGVLEQLKTAVLLAQTGLASGAAIDVGNGEAQDLHNPTQNPQSSWAQVRTARSAAQLWAQVAVCWNLIKSLGLDRDVMLVINHEFGRTAYNRYGADNGEEVIVDGVATRVRSEGTDHAPAAGFIALNRSFTGKQRLGALGDEFAITGTRDGRGFADTDLPAYVSTDAVGTMIMKAFPEYFPDQGTMRLYWKEFQVPISYFL